MAIEMAKHGGLGIIHRYCSIERQVDMVKRVKRYQNFIIKDPFVAYSCDDVLYAKRILKEKNIGCLLIKNIKTSRFEGILSKKDFLKQGHVIQDIMTPLENVFYLKYEDNTLTVQEMIVLCLKNNIENLPILDHENHVKGLVTLKDLKNLKENENKQLVDSNSQLMVGAAVGVNGDFMARTRALVVHGRVDLICIDIAHGHHVLMQEAVTKIKEEFPNLEIMAGNVATPEGVEFLASLGVACVKVGIGPGSICTTRIQTGCGVPQFTAVQRCAETAHKLGVTVIADGGHQRKIGNIMKALAAGASASMLGGFIAGTDESPGLVLNKNGKKVKIITGMAGYLANRDKGLDDDKLQDMVPEGVEGYLDCQGPVKDVLHQIKGGLQSGFSYQGVSCLHDLHALDMKFHILTDSGKHESGSHGIKNF